MKKIIFAVLALPLIIVIAAQRLRQAYRNVVTAPNWCGSYWSSHSCTNQQNNYYGYGQYPTYSMNSSAYNTPMQYSNNNNYYSSNQVYTTPFAYTYVNQYSNPYTQNQYMYTNPTYSYQTQSASPYYETQGYSSYSYNGYENTYYSYPPSYSYTATPYNSNNYYYQY